MDVSTILIAAVGAFAAGVTAFLWTRVRRKVRADERPPARVERANPDPDRVAYPG